MSALPQRKRLPVLPGHDTRLLALNHGQVCAISGGISMWTYICVSNEWRASIKLWNKSLQIESKTAVLHNCKLYAFSLDRRMVRFNLNSWGIIKYPPYQESSTHYYKIKKDTALGIWYNDSYHIWCSKRSPHCTEVADYKCDGMLQLEIYRTIPDMTDAQLSQSVLHWIPTRDLICVIDKRLGKVRLYPSKGYMSAPVRTFSLGLGQANMYGHQTKAVMTADLNHLVYISQKVSWICIVRFHPKSKFRGKFQWILPSNIHKQRMIKDICIRGNGEDISLIATQGWLRRHWTVSQFNEARHLPEPLVRIVALQLNCRRKEMLHIMFANGEHLCLSVEHLKTGMGRGKGMKVCTTDWCVDNML